MCEYIKWIFNPDNINTNIFTVISVVLSGLISWGISAIYFSRGNRNNLKSLRVVSDTTFYWKIIQLRMKITEN